MRSQYNKNTREIIKKKTEINLQIIDKFFNCSGNFYHAVDNFGR